MGNTRKCRLPAGYDELSPHFATEKIMSLPKSAAFKNKFLRYLKLLGLALLAAITPLVMFWADNLGQVRPLVMMDPLLVILLCAFLLFNLVLLVLRSLPKTTLLMFLILFIFFTYGHAALLLPENSAFTGFHLLLLYLLLFIAGSALIFRAKKLPANTFFFAVVVLGLLLVFNIARIVRYDPRLTSHTAAAPVEAINELQTGELPDIYIIILDAYARDDVLQEVYGFDNSAFLDGLRERGFYIPDCAYSNYDSTYDAMASVLNMDYLDTMGVSNNSLGILSASQTDLILNDQARQTFAALGYQFVTARGYGPFNDIVDSDIYLNYYNSQGKRDDLEEKSFVSLFLGTTLFRATGEISSVSHQKSVGPADQPQALIRDTLAYQESEFWYHQTNYVFDTLSQLPEAPGNYLVYAHINAPHGPYVFNRDGSFRFEPDLTHENELYIDEIVYLNQRVLDLIDTLIANSDTPPIIILQADHGTHYFVSGINKHKILSAYYLPGELDLAPYSTITPVNDLLLVLHDYFDPSIKLLPDTLFMMEDGNYQPVPSSCSVTP
jgi:hypothetical protein